MEEYNLTDYSYQWIVRHHREVISRHGSAGEYWSERLVVAKSRGDTLYSANRRYLLCKAYGLFEMLTIVDPITGALLGTPND